MLYASHLLAWTRCIVETGFGVLVSLGLVVGNLHGSGAVHCDCSAPALTLRWGERINQGPWFVQVLWGAADSHVLSHCFGKLRS